MEWKNPIDDPFPSMIFEAHSRGAEQDNPPCSICIQDAKDGKEQREHFHASDVGACARRVLYSMRYPREATSSTSPNFLKDGHLHESSMLVNIHNGFLRDPDITEEYGEVAVKPAENNVELAVTFPYMENGEINDIKLIGHFDGIIAFGNDPLNANVFVIECKAVKAYKFNLIKGGHLDDEWYGQIQTYLRLLKLKRAYLLVKNRETSEILPPIRVDKDSIYLKNRKEKLIEIHRALRDGSTVEREHEKRTDSECKWCKFYDRCWKEPEFQPAVIKKRKKVKPKKVEASIYDFD